MIKPPKAGFEVTKNLYSDNIFRGIYEFVVEVIELSA